MPPAGPEMNAPLGDGERTDGERQVEFAVRVDRAEAPIDAPRPTGSSSATWSMAAIFGAPVTEPPGNVASQERREAVTSVTECALDEGDEVPPRRRAGLGAISSGHVTVPVSQTRERSFRSRSTIITCSAASLADSVRPFPPAGRVPLIGIVHTRRPLRARNSSGEAERSPAVADERPRIERA